MTNVSELRTQIIAAILFLVAVGLIAFIVRMVWPSPYTTEALRFPTNVVPGTTNAEAIDVEAVLYLPRQAPNPWSVVVIAPTSSGVEQAREVYYAKQLAGAGIAAVIVDSFSSRGVKQSVYDQSLLESWQVENDAVAALRTLAADPRFNSDRIAIMGVSKGGTAALDTAHTIRRRWTGVKDVAFAAHIAIAPDCNWTTRSDETTGVPILLMLAELDDQTPAPPCVEKAARMREAGNGKIETRVYEGVHHAWEEIGAFPSYDDKVENYSECRVWIEDDGSMTADATGEIVPQDGWRAWAKKNCMTLGATCCGGSYRLKQKATDDIIAFLQQHGFGKKAESE
jgi:dienelactone hydrolase